MDAVRRRKFGGLLVCISAFAFIVAETFFAHWRVVGSGSSRHGPLTSIWTAVEVKSDLGWIYFIPVILCGAVGVLCLAWPTRKPPKL